MFDDVEVCVRRRVSTPIPCKQRPLTGARDTVSYWQHLATPSSVFPSHSATGSVLAALLRNSMSSILQFETGRHVLTYFWEMNSLAALIYFNILFDVEAANMK